MLVRKPFGKLGGFALFDQVRTLTLNFIKQFSFTYESRRLMESTPPLGNCKGADATKNKILPSIHKYDSQLMRIEIMIFFISIRH